MNICMKLYTYVKVTKKCEIKRHWIPSTRIIRNLKSYLITLFLIVSKHEKNGKKSIKNNENIYQEIEIERGDTS